MDDGVLASAGAHFLSVLEASQDCIRALASELEGEVFAPAPALASATSALL
ncbi:hypothetical protein [Caulobacter endophyticus]|uniref:hypothetical protein n=1 Tax=Caulobacter endophyticus TaxID=2172652 RepID=UPI00130483BC|nr:hypothetical protein [Caulobacter endophyticus]